MDKSFNKKFDDISELIYTLGYLRVWPYIKANCTAVRRLVDLQRSC